MYIVKALLEKLTRRKRDTKVQKAEEQAYKFVPPEVLSKIEQLSATQAKLKSSTKELATLVNQSKQALVLGNLFNLYNTQIEKYQDETRSRASWSFYIALVAMFSGFGFIVWGGQYILTQTNWDHIAAGSCIAAIGGSISAYITKTFLDVHRISIQQLNRYFDQPVINDHILMAQRLADNLTDNSARLKAYEGIISSVVALIAMNNHGTHTDVANSLATNAS
jgi:hypothetical protein